MKYELRGDRIVDLSHPIEPDIPGPVGFPKPELALFRRIADGDVINVDTLTLCPHTGTHIDAASHFFADADSVDKLPPDCILGPAVVVDLRHKSGHGSVPIERDDIEEWENKTGERVREGDAVLLMTGYSRFWKTGPEGDAFITSGWPYVARSFADFALERKVRLVGVESMDLDFADPFDLAGSEFVGHRTFLRSGIHIVESLTNLDKIGAARCCLIATPLNIKGGTGSPVRILALV